VFVRDRLEGTTKRVSVATDGTQANDLSFGPAVSADGGRIAFTSGATNLSSVKNTAANFDVYVREELPVPTTPILSAIVPSVPQLWPPNNKLIDVMLSYTVTAEAGEPSCDVTVSGNELIVGSGTQHSTADWEIVDSHHVRLRAARMGGDSGRVYTITVSCVDGTGQTVSGSTQVTVPHDRTRRSSAARLGLLLHTVGRQPD